MNFRKLLVVSSFVLALLSCKKEIPPVEEDGNKLKNGFLVLNEGLFQLNNSNMSWVDLATGSVNYQIFEERTGRQLGDTGNDMLIYGGKLYVVTSVSSTLEILDAKTLKSIKQLSVVENNTAQQPQNITALNGEIYFSTFGGKVWCVDTATLEVKSKIQVGSNPDKITNDGQYIYVSNSGGLNYPDYDSTVSVIHPVTKTEIKKVTVAANPGEIVVGPDQNIYVITRGNYAEVPAALHRINKQTLEKDMTYAVKALYLINFSNTELVVAYYNSSGNVEVAKFNVSQQQLKTPNFIDLNGITTFYGIQYSSAKNQFYVKDANSYTNSGTLRVYNSSGTFLTSYSVGLNPNKVIYYE